ncbi:MAG TPA: prolipoprotein diacylglyceryl transferase family protein, partial [Polyangiaceae bacterium]|nr:prolipoprotein diacylglyceryl transferase family protein [Polyangiaceae bacterium]
LGCYLEGCDFGRPLALGAPHFLARLGTFPAHSPAWVEHVSAGLLGPLSTASLPVHPSELYEALAGLLLGAFAFGFAPRARAAGDLARATVLGYLTLRVAVDGTRSSSADVWCARFLLIVAVAVTLPWLRQRVKARHP